MNTRRCGAVAAIALLAACAGEARAFPGPHLGITLGFDTSTLAVDEDFFDGSHRRMHHDPTVGIAARWRLPASQELELGVQVAGIGRQSRLDIPNTTAYQPLGDGTFDEIRIDETRGTIDIPLRIRAAPRAHSGWMLEVAVVPSYMTASRVQAQILTGLTGVPAGPTRRSRPARVNAEIFESLGSGFDTRDAFRRWDLRAGVGVGRRIVRGPRTVDVALRFENGVVNLFKAATPEYHSRVFRLALSLM